MPLGRLWAGNIFGTNTGKVFIALEGPETELRGRLHLNDDANGVVVLNVSGTFDGTTLKLVGAPALPQDESVSLGTLTVAGQVTPEGHIRGEWRTTVGTAGAFHVFPHDFEKASASASPAGQPPQFHTARHSFGAIEIDRAQLTALAEDIQAEFKKASVVVSIVAGTEQTLFLKDFKNREFNSARATSAKILAQEPDPQGGARSVTVELGPFENLIIIQSPDDAWVLGYREKLKDRMKRFERTYATNIIKFTGFGTPVLLFWITLVMLPSFDNIGMRIAFFASTVAINFIVVWIHNKFLPNTAIYLAAKANPLIGPRMLSWVMSIIASVAATLLGAFLNGWLKLE